MVIARLQFGLPPTGGQVQKRPLAELAIPAIPQTRRRHPVGLLHVKCIEYRDITYRECLQSLSFKDVMSIQLWDWWDIHWTKPTISQGTAFHFPGCFTSLVLSVEYIITLICPKINQMGCIYFRLVGKHYTCWCLAHAQAIMSTSVSTSLLTKTGYIISSNK